MNGFGMECMKIYINRKHLLIKHDRVNVNSYEFILHTLQIFLTKIVHDNKHLLRTFTCKIDP